MEAIETKIGALEALKKIREAEDHARKIINDAKEGMSLKIIQEAQNEARMIKEKSVEEAKAKSRKIRSELIKKAEGEAAQIREKTRQETETLCKRGGAAQSEAVKLVSEEMRKYFKGGIL
jgi:vacuolar-type H+-ATPase subunit H